MVLKYGKQTYGCKIWKIKYAVMKYGMYTCGCEMGDLLKNLKGNFTNLIDVCYFIFSQ